MKFIIISVGHLKLGTTEKIPRGEHPGQKSAQESTLEETVSPTEGEPKVS